MALIYQQIGVARILITEYSMDANLFYDHQGPCIFALFKRDTPESVIIEFIKEFSVDVNVSKNDTSLLNYSLMCKCFDVVRYLIEQHKVDINSPINTLGEMHFTTLHFAYATNEPTIVDYLIQHGANVNATDVHGRKPIEYKGGDCLVMENSEFLAGCRKIHKVLNITIINNY